jgi:flagellar biosynthesis/type III secretory pathway M-ring protein FliF/YscJ
MSMMEFIRSRKERWDYLNPNHPLKRRIGWVLGEARLVVRALVIAGCLALIGYLIWTFVGGKTDGGRLLCEGMQRDEVRAVSSLLGERGIEVTADADSSRLKAPHDQLREARWQMARVGYPRTGHFANWYDRASSFIPWNESSQNEEYRRAIERELENIQLERAEIDFARVEIRSGKETETNEGSTPDGVTVTVVSGTGEAIPADFPPAIRTLVSKSVTGVLPEEVEVLDSRGILQPDALSEDGEGRRRTDTEMWLARQLEKKAQSLLDQVIFKNQSIVRIDAVLGTDSSISRRGGQEAERVTADGAKISDVRLSVVLLVNRVRDGVYRDGSIHKEDRSESMLDGLMLLVRGAVGFSSGQGDRARLEVLHFDTERKEPVPLIIKREAVDETEVDSLLRSEFEMGALVATRLEKKGQGLLDQVIGRDRSIVKVYVQPENRLERDGSRNLDSQQPRPGRLSVAVAIDETKVIIDAESGKYIEEARPDEEIQRLADLVQESVGFDDERGDQITVWPLLFDKTAQVLTRQISEADERRIFWTNIAKNIAKVAGIILVLIALRFIIMGIGRGMGVEEELEETDSVEVNQTDVLLDEYTKELEAARQMQMSLMPTASPVIDGMDIAGGCRPANHVGGDFFQHLQMDDSRWMVCLADVTGHGMEAAIPVVMFCGVLKSLVDKGGEIDELLRSLNNTMHGGLTGNTLTGRTFVCFSGGELDVNKGIFKLSNAGCPFPFYYRASADEVVELEVEGYPLGVRPDRHYRLMEVALEPGDRVVLCTDGIIEAEDRFGHMFGFDRLAYVIREGCRQHLSAAELRDYVMAEVTDYCEDVAQADDQTLVVIEQKA